MSRKRFSGGGGKPTPLPVDGNPLAYPGKELVDIACLDKCFSSADICPHQRTAQLKIQELAAGTFGDFSCRLI